MNNPTFAPFFLLPTKSPRKYRGKYPTRAHSVSMGLTGYHIELNNGARLWAAQCACFPQLGQEFGEAYANATPMSEARYNLLKEAAALASPLKGKATPETKQAINAKLAAIYAPEPAPAVDSRDIAEAAACLWEAALEAMGKEGDALGGYLNLHKEERGTANLRLEVVDMAPACHAAWEALTVDERDAICFDWDFCPAWLDFNITGRASHPFIKGPARDGVIYSLEATRPTNGETLFWFFDKADEFAKATAICSTQRLSYRIVYQPLPDGDFVTDASEFSAWLTASE